MSSNQDNVHRLKEMIHDSGRVVVFTGAGISTESGIPDFRSPGGIWTKYKPIDFSDFMASEEMRRESWRRKFASDTVMKAARPNQGHLAIAKLVLQGKVSSVITQNVDGLHQLSGVPDEKVIELHGNATYAACLDCGRRFELEDIREVFEKDGILPICNICKGIVKTATISFGQSMPIKEVQAAEMETLASDLFLTVGSSLVVYPAAGFPAQAKRNGAKLVIINRDPTPLDGLADLVLNREIGPTLSAVAGLADA
jgi:NAD-dependent deacetylase